MSNLLDMGDHLSPWNNWFHVMTNTYATWPPGDPRGFRSRHHREHIEGDYKHRPAPGTYDEWLKRSRELMPRGAVILDVEAARCVACLALAEALLHYGCVVEELCVTPTHAHGLVRFPSMGEIVRAINASETPATGVAGLSDLSNVHPGDLRLDLPHDLALKLRRMLTGNSLQGGRDPIPRVIFGKAKSWAAHQLVKQGHIPANTGGVWTVRSKEEPIRDPGHWIHTGPYIRDHVEERGVVLSMLRNKDA